MREERSDDRLAVQMQDLTKAIYALQNEIALSEQRQKMEIALLTKRVEQTWVVVTRILLLLALWFHAYQLWQRISAERGRK